jgi:hypothetical protein
VLSRGVQVFRCAVPVPLQSGILVLRYSHYDAAC